MVMFFISSLPQKPWRFMTRHVTMGCFIATMVLLYCLFTLQFHAGPPDFPVPLSCDLQQRRGAQPATNNSDGDERKCFPKKDIMFMKTHKTASSTFLNILFRFGEKHNLKFAFPDSRNDFSYPSYFRRTYIKGFKSGMCFNIICNHMRFSAAEVARVMPRDSVYITILRDPAELFESSFHYFGHLIPLTWSIRGDEKMAAFLRDPNLYYSPKSLNSFYIKNLLFFDLGQEPNLDPNDARVDEDIRLIADRFQLVMLVEYFEESLILLKDTLCWEMDDVLFFKLNSRQRSTVSKLSPELRERALWWNAIDWKLYRYFNRTFWEKVEAYGRERMAADVKELKRRNAELEKICIEGGRPVAAESIHEENMQPWQPIGEKSIMGYNLNRDIDKEHQELCRKMLTPEIQYLTDMGVNLWLTKLWGHVRNIINI